MYKLTVTENCKLTVVLNGAGGGNGGSDASHKGASGSPGDKVTCIIDAIAGENYYISVGTAGANGASNIRGSGAGAGGTALNGFSGGAGGNSGGSGTSGAGGGGGGATVLYKYVNGISQYIAIAAGGAGGGGAGNYSNAINYQPTKRVTAFYTKYYTNTDNSNWSSTLRKYAVQNGTSTYNLTYDIWSDTDQNCTLFSSADDKCTIYVNGSNIGQSASWGSTSSHSISLHEGLNHLVFTVVNSGGGPTGYGAYIKNSSGSIIWTTRYPNNEYDHVYLAGRGGQGQSNLGDGGGAGGGGGGFLGGAGGTAAGLGYGGDYGAESGYPGVSFAMSVSEINNATQLLKDQWEPSTNYTISVLGGSPKNSNGSFTVSSISTSVNVKNSNSFKPVYDIFYKTSSGWTNVKEIYYKQNGEWISLFAKDSFSIVTISDLAENNISGYMTPYGSAPVSTYDSTSYGGDGGSSVSTGGVSCTDSSGDAIGTSDGGMCSADSGDSGGGGGDGGGKIICTAMNSAYGFGSFRNSIWIKYSNEKLTKAHEVGYHTIFLPLVNYAFYSKNGITNKILRNILEHTARHRTADLRAEMNNRKRDTLGRFYRAIFEPLCYIVGKIKGY